MRIDITKAAFLNGAAPFFPDLRGAGDGEKAFAWAAGCVAHAIPAWEKACPNRAPHLALRAARALMRGEISVKEARDARNAAFWCAETAQHAARCAGVDEAWAAAGYSAESARAVAHEYDMDAMWPGTPTLTFPTPPRPVRQLRRSALWERAHAAARAAELLVEAAFYRGMSPLTTEYIVVRAALAAASDEAWTAEMYGPSPDGGHRAEREWQWEHLRTIATHA